MTFLLGVDGGATKTVALIALATGRIVGAGRAGSSDIHAGEDPEAAVDRVADAVRQAAVAAGLTTAAPTHATFSLCGADWPEDVALYQAGLAERLCLARTPEVVNDAMGALRAGTPDGIGVSMVLGTGGAIGARGPLGATWFTGFRVEPSGAVQLGRLAYDRLLRGEYGMGAVPGFQPAALEALEVDSVEALVHAITRRGGLGDRGVARLAAVLLEAEHQGDPVARAALQDHTGMLAGYVRGAARRVDLPESGAHLALAGGVLRHHCPDLADLLTRELAEFVVSRSSVEPAHGALLLAADAAGVTLDAALLRASGPPADYFETR